MRMRTPYKLAAAAAAAALLVSGCGGGDGGGGDDDAGQSGGTLRVYNSEPAHLVPTAANDQPSILVIRQLYSGLVDYDNESGAPVNDIAESIESDDNVLWTITLKDGYTFHNGEPVNADSFIRSWNYTADGDNGQENSYFMSRIAGFEESQEGADELSGVTKVDDLTFTVELSAPFVGFPAIVGYSGFFPVAEECLADFDACEETPIGNGPYMIEGSWDHNVGITLVRNEEYAGQQGIVDTIDYQIYSDVNAAYSAFQAGELDVMYTVPPERSQEVIQNNPDRIYDEPGHSFTYVGLPQYLEQFEDPRIAQALSMAIDRQAIIDAVFSGRQTPAEGVVSPQFDGFRPGVCEFCAYDPEAAAQLLEEAGGWQWGTLELWANAGSGHEDWLQAVGDQLTTNLGIDYTLEISLQFPEYLEKARTFDFTGAYRLGWGPDYPVMETYLSPLYMTGSSSNYSQYSNEEFDELITQGDGAATLEEAIPFYQQAEDIIVQDLPVIPMWFGKELAVWSENVEEFVWNPINEPEYDEITVAQQ